MSDQHTQGPPANTLEPRIVEALRTIVDPELGANVYDLGLIDGLKVGEIGNIRIRMTLAAFARPASRMLPLEVQEKLTAIPGVCWVEVDTLPAPWQPGDFGYFGSAAQAEASSPAAWPLNAGRHGPDDHTTEKEENSI